jgi:hypothetical protein
MSSYSGIEELVLRFSDDEENNDIDLVTGFYEAIIPLHVDSLQTLAVESQNYQWSLQDDIIPSLATCHRLRSLEFGVHVPIRDEDYNQEYPLDRSSNGGALADAEKLLLVRLFTLLYVQQLTSINPDPIFHDCPNCSNGTVYFVPHSLSNRV